MPNMSSFAVSKISNTRLEKHFFYIVVTLSVIIDVYFYAFYFSLPLPLMGTLSDILTTFGVQKTHDFIVILTIFTGEFACIFVFIYFYFTGPIDALKRQVAYFLTNNKKDIPFSTAGTANPDINYVGSFLGKSLEILRAFKDEMQSGRTLRSEVDIAAELQKHILAKKTVAIPGLDIVANSRSATEVGGDSYDIIKNDHNYYIYLGDATGHGVGAGFVMMIANALISGFSKTFTSSADILIRTNEILKPRVKSNILMSLLMIRYNDEQRKFFMTGCGHEYLIVYSYELKRVLKLQSGGVALGMTKDTSRITKEIPLNICVGDIIVMYTDGITEARNGDKMLFGIERLIESIERSNKTAQDVFNTISIDLSKFMGYRHTQYDDITLIVMHCTGSQTANKIVESEIPPEFITEWNW